MGRSPVPSAPSASAPATAATSRSRSPPCPARFPDDEKSCKALCPATEAALYAYRNPGEDINQAVSVNGQPYTALPNAFKFRTEFNPTCSCRAPGQTWSDALKTIDEKAAAANRATSSSPRKARRRCSSGRSSLRSPRPARRAQRRPRRQTPLLPTPRRRRPPTRPPPRPRTSRSAPSVRNSCRRNRGRRSRGDDRVSGKILMVRSGMRSRP